jgi:hypothetical protein
LPEEENVSEEVVEAPVPYVAPTLYDAWDRPIPTVTLCLEDVDFNRLVNRVVQAGNYGAELNPTKEVKVHGVPYQIHLIMSQEEFDKYSLEEKHASYDESVEYGKVTVQAQDRQLFFKNLLAISKLGAVVEPATGIYKTPTYRASVLTRAPVEASANVIVGPVKVKYSQEELESFDIKQLSIIGSWYNISLKAKKAYVKAILEKQS